MMHWLDNLDPDQVADANRRYYARTFQVYDSTETCVLSKYAQTVLEEDLSKIVRMFAKPAAELTALDACGGSGNVSQKLLKLGAQVTLCDISPELTQLCAERTQEHGTRLTVVNCEITNFLQTRSDVYDLVVFSSALHHLKNYAEVLEYCYLRLKPGGLVYTVFDPIVKENINGIAKVMLGFDYLLFKVHKQPSDLITGILRRFRRLARSFIDRMPSTNDLPDVASQELSADYLGFVAEYYAREGINDQALAERLTNIGYEIVLHSRYVGARYEFFRWVLNAMGQVTSFKFLLKKVN